jgi:hypothetical protein
VLSVDLGAPVRLSFSIGKGISSRLHFISEKETNQSVFYLATNYNQNQVFLKIFEQCRQKESNCRVTSTSCPLTWSNLQHHAETLLIASQVVTWSKPLQVKLSVD